MSRYWCVLSHLDREEGGIQSQDVIIEVDGSKVIDSANLKNLISGGRPKDKTKITVVRNGKKTSLEITLGTRPNESDLSLDYKLDEFDLLGLKVENIKNSELRKKYYDGVNIINIEKGSSAYNDINIGDIIIEMGQYKIKNINDYKSELDNYERGDTIMLRILRNENPLYVAFDIK